VNSRDLREIRLENRDKGGENNIVRGLRGTHSHSERTPKDPPQRKKVNGKTGKKEKKKIFVAGNF